MKPDYSNPPRPGRIFLDVVSGVEGGCLCAGDEAGGKRVAGPKPWGGGNISKRFDVSIEDLEAAIAEVRERQMRLGRWPALAAGGEG